MTRLRSPRARLVRLALCLSLLAQPALFQVLGAPAGPAPQTPPPPLFDCSSQLDPLYARTDVFSLMKARTAAELLAARARLATTIWGPGGLPTAKLPPAGSVETGVPVPLAGMPNLRRVDRITLEMPLPQGAPVSSLRSVIYHFRAENSLNRLMIFHQGHENGFPPLVFTGGVLAIARHLAAGFDVLAIQLPLFGDNSVTALTTHEQLETFKQAGFTPLRFFMDPIAVGLNHALRQSAYRQVDMIGISGGGWATTLYAALDPRVRVSIPVAGTMPAYLREGRCATSGDRGDWEQREVSNLLDYTELYVAGAFGPGRKQLQVLNQFDSCCFSGVRYRTYAPAVKSVLSGIGEGFFDVYLDDSHTTHTISPAATDAAFKLLFDPPVNAAPGAQSIGVNAPLVFSSANNNRITVANRWDHPLRVTLTAEAGTVTLAATAGLTFKAGDGDADPTVTFEGALPALNAALSGLVFRPEPGFSGPARLTVTSGNQNVVGEPAAQTDTDTVFINVGSTVQFERASYEASEGTARAAVFVTRSGGLAAASVDYVIESGTASAGQDFVADSGTLRFAAGEVRKSLEVSLVDDGSDEADENVILTLRNPAGAVLGGPAPAVLRVADDDATPALAVNDLTIREGDAGTVNAVFHVTLSAPSAREVTVSAGTSHVTTDEQDYRPVYVQLSFAPGETSKTVTVALHGDTQREAHETFFLGLVGAQNAAVADAVGFVTINNDDEVVRIAGEATQPAGEGAGKIDINVTRSGNLSQPASVEYRTTDGTATSLGDYTFAAGTLHFAAGDASETFSVLITHDAHDEPEENFNVVLSDAVGAALDVERFSVQVVLRDDDPPGQTTNPNDISQSFVRQHYHDFLNRQPDAGGLQFWSAGIEQCGSDAQCRRVKRVDTSAAFFLSIEFQETGFLAYKARKAAFGNLPGKPVPVTRDEMAADSGRIGSGVAVGVGDWAARLEQNKAAYFNDFAASERFVALYPASLTPEAFVDALNANAGGALSPAERQALIDALKGGAKTRAQALRAVAEDSDLHRAETNRAFVLMQYLGYLRRNPDDVGFDGQPDPTFNGFNFWLQKLNDFGGDHRAAELVRAFIESIEYRRRFGQ